MHKWIYPFNYDTSSMNKIHLKEILGGKGLNLAEMSRLNFPVPPGFTISAELCQYYYKYNKLPDDFALNLNKAMSDLENDTGKKFGCDKNPLLIAVRSGAKDSMPGMMDTILNLGMNDNVVKAIINNTKDPRFAYDNYRRFLEMYGSTVLGVSKHLFENIFDKYKIQDNVSEDSKLNENTLEKIIIDFKEIILNRVGVGFPDNPEEQLINAIESVLKSWMSPRAIAYRKINHIENNYGTAVNVQSMVFGNMGEDSATGVVFSRNPTNGENEIFGEFLINAQGEEVVAGTRTPFPIKGKNISISMENQIPELYQKITDICKRLELHYKDIQDIEFTVEKGKLFILQTRNAKRSIASAIKVAVDMKNESIITKEEALLSIKTESVSQLLHSDIDYSKNPISIASGLPASPGAASGKVVFSSLEAEEIYHYHNVILVRNDTSPEDIQGMHIAKGILTARGGMTSHAAVVARAMGKPCVCGAQSIKIDEAKKILTIGNITIKDGDEITIDGNSGKIFLDKVSLKQPEFSNEFETLLDWADEINGMEVRANADTVNDLSVALKFGAKGVGLCRTEHMFFEKEKIFLMQEMIIATNDHVRKEVLQKLLPLHTKDIKELFKILKDKPINIRLLDPPLHEFLPKTNLEQQTLANRLGISLELLQDKLAFLHEINPMLGHRGCRLGITYPEIYKMQLEAIFNAGKQVLDEDGIITKLEIMIPLISNEKEIEILKEYIDEYSSIYRAGYNNSSIKCNFQFGTMIELPRSTMIAEKIAPFVDYFSFGTNDLTQTTYGISRDDIASFLTSYLDQNIFKNDPFVVIDKEGVGELMKLAMKKAKSIKPQLKFGVCGEHGGNPESIKYFDEIGIDYISCSPFSIPIARLAVAQSRLIKQIF